jgi:hypothetical protein
MTNTIGATVGVKVATADGQIAIDDPANKTVYIYNRPTGGSFGTRAARHRWMSVHVHLHEKHFADFYAIDRQGFEYANPSGSPLSLPANRMVRRLPRRNTQAAAGNPGHIAKAQ